MDRASRADRLRAVMIQRWLLKEFMRIFSLKDYSSFLGSKTRRDDDRASTPLTMHVRSTTA